MKKLMFAAVAAMGLSAAFAIESANIVGYGPTPLADRGVAAAASFVTIGGEKVDLVDIVVKGYEAPAEAVLEIQTLDLAGGSDRGFLWYDIPGDVTGWLEPEEGYAPLERDDVTLFPGEGLWVISDGDGFSLQTSGEVATTADVVTPLCDRGRTVANPTPVNVDAALCYISGYEGAIEAPVEMQTLDPAGGSARGFLWYDIPGDVTAWLEPEEGYAPLEEDDIVLEPGRGLWIISDGDGYNFCWPKVEL